MPLDAYRTLGRSGLRVSPLALGTMTFGHGGWGSDREGSEALLDRYFARGGNFLDTANIYTDGCAEEIVGDYLAARPGLRDRAVVATKFGGSLDAGDPNSGGAGRKALRRQVEGSLRRLRTDYLDLYWLHHFDRHTPIDETVAALHELVEAGKVCHIGLSDTPAWAVARSATLAELRGWAPVIAVQLEYSLLRRSVEGELFGAARAFGLGVVPWSPLAGGVLTGKYTATNRNPQGSGRAQSAGWYTTDSALELVETLRRIARECRSTVSAAALAWVLSRDEVTSPVIGARTVDQLEENLGALEVALPEDALAELDRLSRPTLEFPADFLRSAVDWQQNGATVNGVPSREPERPWRT